MMSLKSPSSNKMERRRDVDKNLPLCFCQVHTFESSSKICLFAGYDVVDVHRREHQDQDRLGLERRRRHQKRRRPSVVGRARAQSQGGQQRGAFEKAA